MDVVDSCMVVLDTNVLLVPYTIGGKSLLVIEDLFRSLAFEQRLVIPGQVAREFARNRPIKLTELFKQIGDKKGKAVRLEIGKYPLLEGIPEYQSALQIERRANELISQYQAALSRVIDHIRGWEWNDPVSVLYGSIITPSVVVDPKIDESAVREDLSRRQTNKIPPGYKDSAKEDNGVGDLLIWRTILHVGAQSSRDLIFVTAEQKADWWHRSGSEALYPRHELVDEYYRASHGKSFHLVSLSRLLNLKGASAEAVAEVRKGEADAVRITERIIPTTMSALLEHWWMVDDEMKLVSRRTAALLQQAWPIAVSHNQVVLATKFEFHYNRLNSDEHRFHIEDVLSRLFGKQIGVKTVLKDTVQSPIGQDRFSTSSQ